MSFFFSTNNFARHRGVPLINSVDCTHEEANYSDYSAYDLEENNLEIGEQVSFNSFTKKMTVEEILKVISKNIFSWVKASMEMCTLAVWTFPNSGI